MSAGKRAFRFHGEKLAGLWRLVHISKPRGKQGQRMLFKKRGEWVRPLSDYDVFQVLPDSVVTNPLGSLEEREPKVGLADRAKASTKVDLSAATRASLPAKVGPQLATLALPPPIGGDWITETKCDSYRLLACIELGEIRLFTRCGRRGSEILTLVGELAALPLTTARLDGEIVTLTEGLPEFLALQNAMDARTSRDIVYFLFDLMYVDGEYVRRVPLWARRARLSRVLENAGEHLRFIEALDAPAAAMFEAVSSLGIEGVVIKRRDALYESGRAQTWLNAKARVRQEMVVCGFTTLGGGRGDRQSFARLLRWCSARQRRHGPERQDRARSLGAPVPDRGGGHYFNILRKLCRTFFAVIDEKTEIRPGFRLAAAQWQRFSQR
ncbi:hypothetical protein [Paraburkholderia sp. Ac-20347]|uniref:ATP-dependent DNA ligase n=1 Tax=Paraburkholderia sp. Ac-20347 TaxID=2703892 RepID=UPI00197F2F3C|nr:hypothetical protein [Paraburkholderia sp. Ac-20347]MBN3808815.1 hypothetical protein [Paraburkholderia sp. Ac-20347]